jgi:hypothetical protein
MTAEEVATVEEGAVVASDAVAPASDDIAEGMWRSTPPCHHVISSRHVSFLPLFGALGVRTFQARPLIT